jgi:hypothetical protein
MMTATRTDLDPGLRALIDDRLDAVERVLLLAGVSRGERGGIVEEVETQVYELLARRTSEEPTRRDVQAVLAALDPPEAYAPEGYRERAADAAAPPVPRPRQPRPSLLAIASAAVGVLTLLLFVVLSGISAEVSSGLGLLLLAVFGLLVPAAVTTGGAVSLWHIRRSDGWLFGLPVALFATMLYPLILANVLLVTAMMLFDESGLFVVAGLAFLTANVVLVYYAWKSAAHGYRRAGPTLEGR